MPSKAESAAEAALSLIFGSKNLTAEKFGEILADFKTLAKNFDTEITRLKDFKVDIHWKSRVILVPKAIDNFRTLIHDLTSGLRDKFIEIARPFNTFTHTLHLLSLAAGSDPLAGGPGGPSKVVTAFGELQDFISGLDSMIGEFGTAIKDASDFVTLFDRVLQDIQHLDDLFLSQKSPRTKTTATYFKRNA